MDRSRRPLLAISAVLACACLVAAATQDRDPKVEARPVRGQVSYLVGAGGNIGVMVGKEGVLMVDDKFAENAKPIEEALKALGGGTPAWVVNTHWHADHTGGNAYFGPSATIVAQERVRRRLNADKDIGGRVADAAPAPAALPDLTFDQQISLYLNGEEVRLIHLGPGHTDGDSVVWFRGSNVIQMGDLFFNIGYPFIDLESGGDVEGVIAACKRVLEFVPPDAAVIPGHGNATDVAGLRTYVAMLEECQARVRKAHLAGQTADQMVAADLLKDFNERWGNFAFVTPERFVRTLQAYVSQGAR